MSHICLSYIFFCYLFLIAFHCGWRAYFVWFVFFYIYYGLFYSLACHLFHRMFHMQLKWICILLLLNGAIYRGWLGQVGFCVVLFLFWSSNCSIHYLKWGIIVWFWQYSSFIRSIKNYYANFLFQFSVPIRSPLQLQQISPVVIFSYLFLSLTGLLAPRA